MLRNQALVTPESLANGWYFNWNTATITARPCKVKKKGCYCEKDKHSILYKRGENRDNRGNRINWGLYGRLERRGRYGLRIGVPRFGVRILICIRRRQVTVTQAAIVTVEVLRAAALAIVAGFTGRFAVNTVAAIKTTIITAAAARFGDLRKVEVIIVTGYGIFFGIGL